MPAANSSQAISSRSLSLLRQLGDRQLAGIGQHAPEHGGDAADEAPQAATLNTPGRQAMESASSSGYSNISLKMLRRDQRGEHAAQRTAERHPQIELGQVARRRPRLVQRAVRHHGRR